MDYPLVQPFVAAKGVSLVNAAGTSLFKMVVPTGYPPFVLQAVSVLVTVACGDTTNADLNVYRTPSGGAETLLKATTAVGVSAAIGTMTYDETPSVTGLSNEFYPGDTLEIKVKTTATDTGTANLILWIGDGPPA